MKVKKSNAYIALVVMVLIAIIFMGYYYTMKPYAMLYTKFMNDSEYTATNETACKETDHGYWYDSSCHQLSSRAVDSINFQKKIWLTAPWILVVGLLFWLFTKFTKGDPQNYYG